MYPTGHDNEYHNRYGDVNGGQAVLGNQLGNGKGRQKMDSSSKTPGLRARPDFEPDNTPPSNIFLADRELRRRRSFPENSKLFEDTEGNVRYKSSNYNDANYEAVDGTSDSRDDMRPPQQSC